MLNCPKCESPTTALHPRGVCHPCAYAMREAEERAEAIVAKNKAKAEKASGYLDTFPEVIRETDPARLSEKLRALVDGYDPRSRQSVILFGETRTGKTRAAFLLAKKFVEAYGREPTFLTMRGFAGSVEKAFRDRRHSDYLDELVSSPFLVFDDLGNGGKMSERFASDFFALVDERTSNRRPTIITTNLVGAILEERLSSASKDNPNPELASALVARLREFFKAVSLVSQK